MGEYSKHEIEAYYTSDGEWYRPVLECSCGFHSGLCANWEQAGQIMDDHLGDLLVSNR